ncbi:response regulator [Desulfosarcina alkanivorans]|uniref:response regulator n=1 Tax=Desulfosarcina alkanivorans TaxID=571177 RepID=UPI0012D2DD92|nr:response regulator [Desulfosarcina alkanivorans]
MLKIIVVDSEKPEKATVKMIESCGFRVSIARTGKAALKLFGEADFDLILLDMFLPDCMGYELIPDFRKKNPDVRIISTTTYNTREIETNSRALGVTYYMSKPFRSETLKSLLKHMARQIDRRVGAAGRNQGGENATHSTRRLR